MGGLTTQKAWQRLAAEGPLKISELSPMLLHLELPFSRLAQEMQRSIHSLAHPQTPFMRFSLVLAWLLRLWQDVLLW
jgi:hypothetical protein